jgi:surface carbohydrate biosynthesis protein
MPSKHRDPDLLWLIEHNARELDVACAAAAHLQRRGFTVRIVHMWQADLFHLSQRITPRLVALPYAYGTRRGFMENYLPQWRTAAFVNLAWEQFYEKAYQPLKHPEDPFVRCHVIHHAWSPYFRDYLLAGGVPPENIFLNGHPALALYQPPYNRAFPDRAALARQFHLDPARRWVFFPETYSWAFRDPKWFDTQHEWGVSRADIHASREFCAASLPIVLDWLRQLAQTAPVEIILRPRPTTSRADFQQLAGELPPNVHFNKEHSIREWILASDAVFSSHSTSLIEAATAGKPATMALPLPLPEPMRADWMARAPQVNTAPAFLAAALNEGSDPAGGTHPLASWAQAELLGNGDPIRGLADFLASLLSGAPRPPAIPPADLETLLPRGYAARRAWQALPPARRRYQQAWKAMARARKRSRRLAPEVAREDLPARAAARRTAQFRRLLG